MGCNPIWVLFIVIFLVFPSTNSEEEELKRALVRFMDKLAPQNARRVVKWGWNLTSDPCTDEWHGVDCHRGLKSVKSIVLEGSSLTGILDTSSLCTVKSLEILSLKKNNLHGLISEDIGSCKSLTLLYLSGNNFSEDLPLSFIKLTNLKRLDVSDNNFSGELPDISHITGLKSFLAQNNKFTGEIPEFDFSNLLELNVSDNNLQGPIPDVGGRFHADGFTGNPNLCGTPLPNACPPSPPPYGKKSRKPFPEGLAIFSGYVILLVIFLLFVTIICIKKFKTKAEAPKVKKKEVAVEITGDKPSETSNEDKNGNGFRSEYSATSIESGMTASNLVVLSVPAMKAALRFKDLLRAPAELVGRGKHGSLYKVMLDNGVILAVKRIKDWEISKQDFERRMLKIDPVKHPYVLPLVAYHCSKQEKLLVYEYLHNGSLFKMLYGKLLRRHCFRLGYKVISIYD